MILELTKQNILNLTNEGDDFFPGGSMGNVNRPRFNLCNKGGKLKAGSKAESLLTDKLKELRKELMRDGNA